jgi:hypothetical protein
MLLQCRASQAHRPCSRMWVPMCVCTLQWASPAFRIFVCVELMPWNAHPARGDASLIDG